jgi:MinD superfamily P-loop ATPase
MSGPSTRPGLVIAVASGKGGTGKTTVAVNLALAAGRHGLSVELADCDVEEPNAHIFMKPQIDDVQPVMLARPAVNNDLCTGCGKCVAACQFNAIACVKQSVVIFPELCHGCGACWLICPEKAITEGQQQVGVIEAGRSDGVRFVHGKVEIGEAAASPPIVRRVKAQLDSPDVAIIDAPPGTTCPMVAAVHETDVACLVTEPTPFGLNDLKIAVETVRELGVPMGVVVNRAGIGDDRVQDYCRREGIPILIEIPHDLRIAQAYSRGEIVSDAVPALRPVFDALLTRIQEVAGQ